MKEWLESTMFVKAENFIHRNAVLYNQYRCGQTLMKRHEKNLGNYHLSLHLTLQTQTDLPNVNMQPHSVELLLPSPLSSRPFPLLLDSPSSVEDHQPTFG